MIRGRRREQMSVEDGLRTGKLRDVYGHPQLGTSISATDSVVVRAGDAVWEVWLVTRTVPPVSWTQWGRYQPEDG